MSENRKAAEAFLRELEKQRETYRQGAFGEIRAFFKERKRRPPEEFHNSSFLYIRSFDGDIGTRPFSNLVFWNSPDILISPISNVGAYTAELNAGDTYLIRCALRNRGDLAVPGAKVELFLVTPSLGFDTRFATNLTLGNVPSAWVTSNGSAAADFVYTVPPSEAGHKCLFARTFSFSPLERPLDLFALNPTLDRHVAQKNLNIVGQSQAYAFNLIHMPTAEIRLSLRAMTVEALLRLGHPVLAELTPFLEPPRGELIGKAGPKIVDGGDGVGLERDRQGITVRAQSRGGATLAQQRKLNASVRKLVTAVQAGKATFASGRELLAARRKLSAETRLTRFQMTIPDLGLKRGQALGLNLTATDHGVDPPEVIGGITLIVS